MDDDVGVDVLQDRLRLVGDGDAESPAGAGRLAQVQPRFGRMGVDGGDDLDLRAVQAEAHHLRAYGTDTVVYGPDSFLRHVRLHIPGLVRQAPGTPALLNPFV